MDKKTTDNSISRITCTLQTDELTKKPILIFPKGKDITTLPKNFFASNKDFNIIHIPETVKIIEDNCFNQCSNLEEITLPNSIHTIGKNCFKGCYKLKSIHIPDTLKSLENGAFSFCRKLKTVTLPNSLTRIPKLCFFGCDNLSSLNINNSFNLEGINLSDNITVLEDSCFGECNNIKTFKVPDNITYIGKGAFENCKSLEEFIFNDNITDINEQLLINCRSLHTIHIPKNLENIHYMAFSGCESLKQITLPETLSYIGESSFSYCTELKEIIIPQNVQQIDNNAFENCNKLEAVTILSNNIKYIGNNIFDYCSNIKYLNIPQGTLNNNIFDFSNMSKLKTIIYNNRQILNLNENEQFTDLINNDKYICINYLDKNNKSIYKVTTNKDNDNNEIKTEIDLTTNFLKLFNHDALKNIDNINKKANICLNMMSILDIEVCNEFLNKLSENMLKDNTNNMIKLPKNKIYNLFNKIKNKFIKFKEKDINSTNDINPIQKLYTLFENINVQKVPKEFNELFLNNMNEIVNSKCAVFIDDIINKKLKHSSIRGLDTYIVEDFNTTEYNTAAAVLDSVARSKERMVANELDTKQAEDLER